MSDSDEALSMRLRDLAIVELDALCAGLDGSAAAQLVGAHAEDVAHALREARTRIAALKGQLGGPDPLNVLDIAPRMRASDQGRDGAERARAKLVGHAETCRAIARLAELSAPLISKLFEADRRRAPV